MDRLISKDTVDLCCPKLFLVGPPGVGKTTTLSCLLGKYRNICTTGEKARQKSTSHSNVDQMLSFVGQGEEAKWLAFDNNEDEAAYLIKYLFGSQSIKDIIEPYQGDDLLSHYAKSRQQIQLRERLRKIVHDVKYFEDISHLGNILLNINIIGGQPGFLEMLPALSAGPAIYLIFFDLSKELNQLYEIDFGRDNTVITPFREGETVESNTSKILCSITSAHLISQHSSSLDPQKAAFFGERFQNFHKIYPVAVLIGTHLDKLGDQEMKVKETSESLKKVAQKFPTVVVTPPSFSASSSPFFSVNNYDGEEAADIAPIRNFLNGIFHTRFQNASLPVQKKWLILNIILRKEYLIAELNDCYEIGEMLDMDTEEVKLCLWYLNHIGTLVYNTKIADEESDWFKNNLICSLQVIFDSISELIVAPLSMLHVEGHVSEFEREELIKKGQFSVEIMETYSRVHASENLKKELIPAKQLIQLLKHVHLLSAIIHKEADGERITYLMPAILDCATQDELTAPPSPDADNPEPLIITFKCGYVPTGTFCGLISQLISRGPNGILDFVWDLVEDGVKRNLVSFYFDFVNKVTLICHDGCFEIRLICDDPDIPLHELCVGVLSGILFILRESYGYLTPEFAFRCPCPKHRGSRSITNLCTLIDTKRLRFLCERRPVRLNEAQKVWLGEHLYSKSSSRQQFRHDPNPGTLNLKEVKKVMNDARFKWFDIGIELDIDSHMLKDIRTRNRYVVDDCFTEMLSHWLSRPSPPPTWSALAKALSSPVIGRPDIAGTIKLEPESDSEPVADDCELTLKYVRRITWEIRSEWRNLGSQLGVDTGTLDEIEGINRLVVDDCFTEMLFHWLQRSAPPPTWTDLIDALKSPVIGRYDIAKEVETYEYEKAESATVPFKESTSKIKFITNPKDTTSRQGSRVEFYVQTAPAAKSYQWEFQNHLISNEDANYKGVLTANLIITKCLPKHKGAYKCVAMNESRKTFTSVIAILKIETPLSHDDVEALRGVVLVNGLKPNEFPFGDSPCLLEPIQQLLIRKGKLELAENILEKMKEVLQIQEKNLQRFDDLMSSKDAIDLCYLKVFLVGPPGVGKTTTLNRLLKEYENLSSATEEERKRRSTLLANCTQVLAFVSEDKSDWSSSSKKDEAVLLIKYLEKSKPQGEKEIDSSTREPSSEPEQDEKKERKPREQENEETIHEVTKPELSMTKHDNTAKISSVQPKPSKINDSDERSDAPLLKQEQKRAVTKTAQPPLLETLTLNSKNPKQAESTGIINPKVDQQQQSVIKIIEQLRELVRGGGYDEAVSQLGNTLLNINDVGGQPGFLEMLPALNTGPAVYLVFLDLTKELNEQYQIDFDRDGTVITPFKSLHTVKSTISQILSSIASAQCTSQATDSLYLKTSTDFAEKLRVFQEIPSVAILIGTHLDKFNLSDQEKKIVETSEGLQESTTKFTDHKILLTPPHGISVGDNSKSITSLFFPVNNLSGLEVSDIAPIRNCMNAIFRSHFQKCFLPIKKRWLIFNILLRKNYRIATLEDCYIIGKELEMSEEDVIFCLRYFTCIGTLMYYPNIPDDKSDWFKNHVICTPQVIFDSISELIVETLRELHGGDTKTFTEKEELIKKGQFSLETIEKFADSAQISEKVKRKDLIPAMQLIKLLSYVNLLSPIVHKEENGERITYLMPAILECETLDEFVSPPIADANIAEPLHIQFNCGYVPTGSFCGLITHLVSNGPEGILGKKWGLVEDTVKRNYTSFYVDYVNKVTLLSHDRCYEIRVFRGDPKTSLNCLCSYVHTTILYILKSLYPNLVPQTAFRCPCAEHSACKDINLCVQNRVSRSSIQFHCLGKCVDLKAKHLVWFSKPTAVGESSSLGALTFAEESSLMRFTFSWSIVGSTDTPSVDPIKPNFLTFSFITEKDFGVFKCEVTEAGKTVLTLYRALCRDKQLHSEERQDRTPGSDMELQDDLTHLNVVKATVNAQSRWFDLGVELDIEVEVLKKICQYKENTSVDDCHRMMLKLWIKRKSPVPSWSALVEAFSSEVIHRFDIANEIKDNYKMNLEMEAVGKRPKGCLSLKWVRRDIWSVRSQWRHLGIELDIDFDTLEEIKRGQNNFTMMLNQWLVGSPSWSALIDALKSKAISRFSIANRIKFDNDIKEEPSLEKGPGNFTLKEVRRVTWDLCSEWESLGIQLGVSSDKLKAIEKNHQNVEDCLTDMLSYWLNCSQNEPTWNTLLEAISDKESSLYRGDIALDVKEQIRKLERQQATAKEGTVKESGTQLMECETQQTVKGADEHRTSSTDVQKPDTGRGLQTRKGEPVSEASPGKVGNQTAVEYKTEESDTQLLEENMCETLPTLIESTDQETSCIIENELKIPSFRKAEVSVISEVDLNDQLQEIKTDTSQIKKDVSDIREQLKDLNELRKQLEDIRLQIEAMSESKESNH